MVDDILQRLDKAFRQHGRQLYLVGGSVRDLLLHRPTHDLDLTTDAPPEETRALARDARPDSIYGVGERFGTIGLVFDGLKVEITTFRSEEYQPKSRKPAVAFGRSLEDDLARRDFTINAIARDLATGEFIDPFRGLVDLRDGVIRAVGDPEERFREDPLRLLRACRFAAELGFAVEPATATAIRRSAESLQFISWERIAEEMNRLLCSPRPARGLRLLDELGLMRFVIPEILEMHGMPADEGRRRYKDVYEHTLIVVDRTPPTLPLRWAALLHDVAKPRTLSWEDGEASFIGHERVGAEMARQILQRLRLDSALVEKVTRLVELHTRINFYRGEWTDGAVRRFIREAGDELWDLFALSRADITSKRAQRVALAAARVDELERRCRHLIEQENVQAIQSPLDGHELMALFDRGPGPWIKPVKEYLLNLVLDGHLAPDDKETATKLAREFVEGAKDVTGNRDTREEPAMQLINRTVKDFLSELASGAPTPGGGSVGALAGALAAGLVSMVANLTLGHPRYVQFDAPMREVLAESERLRRLLMELVDADAAAYRAVSDARHRSRQHETERQIREAEIQNALRQATDVPLRTAQACRETLDLCWRTAEIGNQNAISDVGTAAELADAGLRSAELNARLNLRSMQDGDYVHHTQRQLRSCLEGADTRRDEILAAVRARIG